MDRPVRVNTEITGFLGLTFALQSDRRRSHVDEQPHIGKYRLLKTIGKGNFAKGTRVLPTAQQIFRNIFYEFLVNKNLQNS